MILTNETVQSILDSKNERFKLNNEEILDQFKEKIRKNIWIRDTKEIDTILLGIVTINKEGKVINSKEFIET